MFNPFNKKKERLEPPKLLNWEKPKTLEALTKIDFFSRKKVVDILCEGMYF